MSPHDAILRTMQDMTIRILPPMASVHAFADILKLADDTLADPAAKADRFVVGCGKLFDEGPDTAGAELSKKVVAAKSIAEMKAAFREFIEYLLERIK